MRRPVVVAVGATAVLVAAATPVVWLQLTPASVTAVPPGTQADRGLALLRDRVGPGVITPIEVVLATGERQGSLTPAVRCRHPPAGS